jgi:hypothetical protein
MHIEKTEAKAFRTFISKAKAFRTFISIYSSYKSERLSASIKLTLHKALIRSVTTYARPSWDLAADTHLLKLQRLQNKVVRTTENFPRCTPVHDLHTAFNLPYCHVSGVPWLIRTSSGLNDWIY